MPETSAADARESLDCESSAPLHESPVRGSLSQCTDPVLPVQESFFFSMLLAEFEAVLFDVAFCYSCSELWAECRTLRVV